jgi:ClpP class serine protease
VFEAGRVFYGDDAELLALIDQLLRQEEGDGDATTSAD